MAYEKEYYTTLNNLSISHPMIKDDAEETVQLNIILFIL